MLGKYKTAYIIYLAFLMVFICSRASADVPCQQNIVAGQKLSKFLINYYGSDCINSTDIQKELSEKWHIVFKESKDGAAELTPEEMELNYYKIIPAWDELSKAFLGISSDGTPTELKTIFEGFSYRALHTGLRLQAVLNGAPAGKKALYRSDSWDFNSLVLSEFSEDGEASFSAIDPASSFDDQCKDTTSPGCKIAVAQGKALMLNWSKAKVLTSIVSSEVYLKVAQSIREKDKLWNTYLYDSKPMYPLDHFFTDMWNAKEDIGFPKPPRKQYFVIHPTVSLEYASAATDGQQLKPVLLVEVLGINWWNLEDRPHKGIPLLNAFSGISLTASYADRAGVKDNGYGALFTFNNVYSIGVSRYGTETAVSVSMDLANLFRDRLKGDYWSRKLKAEGGARVE